MFLTPYSTTVGSNYKLETIFSGIRRAEINGELIPFKHPQVPDGIFLVGPKTREFQPFNQPIIRKDFPDMSAYSVVDGRSFLRVADGTPLKTDLYNLQCRYAKLCVSWAEENGNARRNLMQSSDYHHKIFAGWLSGELARRLALDPVTELTLRMMLLIHYIQMGNDILRTNRDKSNMLSIATMASRKVSGSNPMSVFQKMFGEEIPYLATISDTVEWIKSVIDSPAINQLSVGLVYSIVGGSVFPSMRETLSIGLEYPPAFTSVLYSTLTERGANKTGLGRFLMNSKDRNSESHFLRLMDHMMEEGFNE